MDLTYDFISNINNDTYATKNLNVTYSAGEDKLVERPPDALPPVVMIILIVSGTIGNLLVCLVISLDRKLQNLTNYFLLSLAVTDLLVSILILPGRLITVRYEFQPSTFPLCFLYLIGDDFITAASAIHICFISLERYFAIRNPLDRRNLTKKRVITKISLVWVIAFITVIPYMSLAIITEHPNEPWFCPNLLSNFKSFETIVLIEALIIVVMVVIVVVSFVLTTILLRRLAKIQTKTTRGGSGLVRNVGGKTDNDKVNNKKSGQILRSEEKALRVVWLVSFAFIICMTPYTITNLQFLVFPEVVIPPILLEITAYLNYLNSVINPIIYTIFNKAFRNDFKNIILFRWKNEKK